MFKPQLSCFQSLFDPINPDKDTIATRELNVREMLDNEFWLLQKLEAIMEKANFRMLPKEEVKTSLEEHKARNGVIVSFLSRLGGGYLEIINLEVVWRS